MAVRRALRARSARMFTERMIALVDKIDNGVCVNDRDTELWKATLITYSMKLARNSAGIDVYWMIDKLVAVRDEPEPSTCPHWLRAYTAEINFEVLYHIARQSVLLIAVSLIFGMLSGTNKSVKRAMKRLSTVLDGPEPPDHNYPHSGAYA